MRKILMKIVTFLAILTSFFQGCTRNTSNKDFNIVLITIDALRPDHLSCYGYKRRTSPTIDKIAKQGVIFKNAVAPSTWTAPSMVSLFTSTYPINHGVIDGRVNNGKVYDQQVFSDELVTLTEVLQKNGYTTFGVASNLHLGESLGFARGFDFFECLSFLPAPSVNKALFAWEDEIKKSNKFFLWIHYIDPHFPYHPRKPWINYYTSDRGKTENIAKLSIPALWERYVELTQDNQTQTKQEVTDFVNSLLALYDSDINYIDYYLRSVIQKFKLNKNTLIVITSDHGEGFFEHRILGHTYTLYQETIHIPLIVKLPRSTQGEIFSTQVNLVDIFPSILQLLNIDPPEHVVGKPFLSEDGIRKGLSEKEGRDCYFSELGSFKSKAILTDDWKYIYNYDDETDQLYNLKKDPLETNNLAEKETVRCRNLKARMFEWVSNAKKYPVKEQCYSFTLEEKEKLEALGYIETQ
jgi:arylsulfatase A-like enzyme